MKSFALGRLCEKKTCGGTCFYCIENIYGKAHMFFNRNWIVSYDPLWRLLRRKSNADVTSHTGIMCMTCLNDIGDFMDDIEVDRVNRWVTVYVR